MAGSKIKRLNRLKQASKQRKEMAEIKLIQIQNNITAVSQEEGELHDMQSSGQLTALRLPELIHNRLSSLSNKKKYLSTQLQQQQRRVTDLSLAARRTEEMVDHKIADEVQKHEVKIFQEILERAVFPKK